MSQKCVGCNMPHLQQLLCRVRRIWGGLSSIPNSQHSGLPALGHLKHAAWEALDFPLGKMKGITFLGQVFQHRRKIMAGVSAGLDLIPWKTWRLVKTKTAIMGLCRPRVRSVQSSFWWSGYVHTSPLHNYYITAFLSWLCFKKNNTSTSNTRRLIPKGTGRHLWTRWQPGRRNRKFTVPAASSSSDHARFFRWACRTFVFVSILFQMNN